MAWIRPWGWREDDPRRQVRQWIRIWNSAPGANSAMEVAAVWVAGQRTTEHSEEAGHKLDGCGGGPGRRNLWRWSSSWWWLEHQAGMVMELLLRRRSDGAAVPREQERSGM